MNPVQFEPTGSLTLPATAQLSPGRVLTVRVNSIFSDGRLRISLDGSFLIADRTQNLPELTEGTELRAVVRGSDSQGRIVLELVPDVETGLLRRLNLPDTDAYRAITEAFARTGLPLDPAALEAGARRLRLAREDLPLAARLIALLRHKGLPDSLDSRLLPLFTPGASDGDEGDDPEKRGHHKDRRGEYRRSGDFNSKMRTEKSRPLPRGKPAYERRVPGHAGRDPAQAIRKHVEREYDTVHELHLFNHCKEKSGHWTIIPLKIDPFDRVTLSLRFDSTGRADTATLRISWDDVRVQAHWATADKRIRMATNRAWIADLGNERIHRLRGPLQQLGVHVDTISISSSLDGFSDEAIEKILRPFDRNV